VLLARLAGLVCVVVILAVLVFINIKVNPLPVTEREPTGHHHDHGQSPLEAEGAEEMSPEEIERIVSEYEDKLAVVETDFGTIKFKFYPEDAPRTVENFAQLTRKGFYKSSPFHRVVEGFVIQSGSPDGSPGGGPGYTIPAEFNKRMHVEGTVAMARSNDPNSAGSQFYICLDRVPHLDGKYTVFGQVVEGMDVVKKIGEVETDADNRPLENILLRGVMIEGVSDSSVSE
jgi:cyclophilin family peptidyl-prolyl cis-trans isomerase